LSVFPRRDFHTILPVTSKGGEIMKAKILGAAALAAVAASSAPAWAGIYSDDATRCIAKSTTEADRLALVKWIFLGIAAHPSIKEYSNVSAEQRIQIDRQMGALVMKLLTKDCHKETVEAMRFEGGGFLEKSFTALGEIAMGGLMTNPEVSAALTNWATPEDKAAFAALAAEAGRPVPPKP